MYSSNQRKMRMLADATYAIIRSLNNKGIVPIKNGRYSVCLPHASLTVNESNVSKCIRQPNTVADILIKENIANAGQMPSWTDAYLAHAYDLSDGQPVWQGKQTTVIKL